MLQISSLTIELDLADSPLAERQESNPEVKSVVVGMHEALPDSIANYHSMGDNLPTAGPSERRKRSIKLCWLSATKATSPSTCSPATRIFIWRIFSTRAKLKENGAKPLPGWIVGTAGAVRYPLPDGRTAARRRRMSMDTCWPRFQPMARSIYVRGIARIRRSAVRAAALSGDRVPWCFAHNSMNREPTAADITPRCMTPTKCRPQRRPRRHLIRQRIAPITGRALSPPPAARACALFIDS